MLSIHENTMRKFITRIVILLLIIPIGYAAPTFEIDALGVKGGLIDGNLSAYLVKVVGTNDYIALDAGTLANGLLKTFPKDESVNILQNHLPVYLISHAHFDHVMGLIIAQPELKNHSTLLARKETLDALQNNIFNWAAWGNFLDSGVTPHLNYQHAQTLALMTWTPLPNTQMSVKAFPLSHSIPSTAFLIRYQNQYLLYLGDTGADRIEKSNNLKNLWTAIYPLIQNKQLHTIMIECSFTNNQPDQQLSGHLNPALILEELHQLAKLVNPNQVVNSLKGLTVIATHVKPRINNFNTDVVATKVAEELEQGNNLGVKFIVIKQGDKVKG